MDGFEIATHMVGIHIRQRDEFSIQDFSKNVFINCPLDDEYTPLLQAILFCLIRFGFIPRIATERMDSGEIRLDKIRVC